MGKYIKVFENHSDYQAFTQTEDFLLPNVSYCEAENEVHYNPLYKYITLKIVVEDSSKPTRIYYYNSTADPAITGMDRFDKIYIDDNEVSIEQLDADSGTYSLSVGEHIIKYLLKDPTKIPKGFNYNTEVPVTTEILSIPNTVTTIEEGAFSGCGITYFNIPKNIVSIGAGAFGYNLIKTLNIPDNVQSIGEYAFGDNGLAAITINNATPIPIGYKAFGDFEYNYSSGSAGSNPIHILVPKDSINTYRNTENYTEYLCRIGSLDKLADIEIEYPDDAEYAILPGPDIKGYYVYDELSWDYKKALNVEEIVLDCSRGKL